MYVWEKAFALIGWKNKQESRTTPLGARLLVQQENAINEIDDRVILLNQTKAEQADLLTSVQRVTYNKNTGVFVFTWHNGETLTVDLNTEKIPVSFSMDADGIITMTNTDGTKYTCDVKSLIKAYLFKDSSQVNFTLTTNDAGNYEVTASIIAGSITKAMLEPNLMGEIEGYKTNAAASAGTATQMAASAEGNAKTAKSYAVGSTGSREGEDTDNAKYYAQKAKESADTIGNTFTTDDVIPIANGGTGAKTAKAAEFNITSGMTESISDMSDTSQIPFVYVEASATQGRFYWRKATYLWNYIKSKISSELGLTKTTYNGHANSATTATMCTLANTATADKDGNNIASTYATKTSVMPVNNLLATTTGKPLDAVQGKALDERLSALEGEMELLGSVMVSSGGKSASKTLDIDVTQYRFLVLTLEQESPTQIITRTTYASTIAKAYTPCVMHCTYVNFSGTTISSVLKGKYNQSTGELLFESTNATAYQQARLYGIK